MAKTDSKNKKVYESHVQRDPSIAEPLPPQNDRSITTLGKISIFLFLPTMVGIMGLYASYLQQRNEPDRKLNFDNDFMNPFLLALAMCVVIFIQTGGFRSDKFAPLIKWPKARRVKKSKPKTE